MTRVMARAESKVQLLSRWTNETVDAYNDILINWQEFNDLLATHKDMIQKQVKQFRFREVVSINWQFDWE